MKRIKRVGVAAEIHDRRRNLKWSVKDLVDATGNVVAICTVYNIEWGKSKRPCKTVLLALREALTRGEELARLTGTVANPSVAANDLPPG